MQDRAKVIDGNLLSLLDASGAGEAVARADPDGPVRTGSGLTRRQALRLFESQATSRHLDFAAREMRARGEGFYTIGSSGHEGNAVTGALTRHTDPAFLHYRSGAFFLERARQRPGETPIMDILLSLAASAEDPISGGRHKVFGSESLNVPPMTSTIASHLPRTVGAAFFHERGRHLGLRSPWPDDAIVVTSFGDASVNHNVAAGAFNSAAWAVHQAIPLPILFVCEDNGIGISVRTPVAWVERAFRGRRGFRYFRVDATDLAAAWDTTANAVEHCRRRRTPVFLHLKTVRLLGHAGTDVESGYRAPHHIEEAERRDPLLVTARLLLDSGAATGEELRDLYEEIRARVGAAAREAARRPKLEGRGRIVEPLAPRNAEAVKEEAARAPSPGQADEPPRPMATLLARALHEQLAKYDDAFVFGEDVARKGGVYYVTRGLLDAYGPSRVFNTLLDETSILGVALGGALMGYLPIPEIQYLAYLHNAEDQLRGEAASLSFFSGGRFKNGMVVRIASFGYQKGFGGHFHNDNSIAVLRDIPGLVIAAPSRPADAVRMLRTACAAAKVDGTVTAFLEPIALYHERDRYEAGDGKWQEPYPEAGDSVPIGSARVDGDGADLTIITYANGVRMSLRAAQTIREEHGIGVRVVDLRWLAPLDREAILFHARATGLVVDEGRETGGVGEQIVTLLALQASGIEIGRVAALDTFIPTGNAASEVLVSEEEIVDAAVRHVRGGER